MPEPRKEHFVTLFDDSFLPLGLALHESLCLRSQSFHLWVVCMDEAVTEHLRKLALPDLTPIPLAEVETPQLLAVKPVRSRAEYCWTLTPFSFSAVFQLSAEVERVTYLDADLFMFDDPRVLLKELDESARHVLITEHAYGPEYDHAAVHGRFCVQFVTFDRSAQAAEVLRRWQAQCLECCSADSVDGKFGDQKYLDEWPTRFADAVHVLRQTEKTLAPWNVNHVSRRFPGPLAPVFYHFHGFRLLGSNRARLHLGYRLGRKATGLYADYLTVLGRILQRLNTAGIAPGHMTQPKESFGLLRQWYRAALGIEGFGRIRWSADPGKGDRVMTTARLRFRSEQEP